MEILQSNVTYGLHAQLLKLLLSFSQNSSCFLKIYRVEIPVSLLISGLNKKIFFGQRLLRSCKVRYDFLIFVT